MISYSPEIEVIITNATDLAKNNNHEYVTLEHLLVDNCAMQLVLNPKQFDVLVTENMFGDILSDEGAVLAEALRGESVAANTYAEAVMNLLPPNARPVIERQYAEIRSVQHELDEITLPAA